MTRYIPKRIAIGISMPTRYDDVEWTQDPNEERLLEQALWFAKATGAALELVSVIEVADATIPSHEMTVHDVLRDRQQVLLDELTAKCDALGVETSAYITAGKPWEETIRAVKNRKYELVMVSPRRKDSGLVDRILHGSTTERLLRKCPCPVWVVDPDKPVGIDRIVVAADFSDVSLVCARTAEALAEVCDAELHLIHAPEYPQEIALRRLPDADEAIAHYRQTVQAEVSKQVDQLTGDRRDDWHVTLASDWIVRSLPIFVEENSIDLVVMGSIGRRGLPGFLVGNTAEKIFRMLGSAVWVAKPEGWITAIE